MNDKTRIIAMYLPQYHRIPENDNWWGKGFTEWNNVKRAKPLFYGHLQPRVPLHGDYYDLSDPNVLRGQMQVAKDFGIDGFCFYHYWFKGGKMLLEKPTEALLEENRIPLQFMFCWANEPWTRTWDGEVGSKKVLMEQQYGSYEDWKRHFDYLLKFFRREEYIKIDEKPVICIYRPGDIQNYKQFIDYWNDLAQKNGFVNGIYVINVYRGGLLLDQECYSDAVMDFEPFASMWRFGKAVMSDMCNEYFGEDGSNYEVIDYNLFGKRMVEKFYLKESNHFMGLFTGWDNSPRIGERVSIIFENNSPIVFGELLEKMYQKSNDLDNELLFINAWNEWGEGTFLEPDEQYGYGYLKEIQRIKKII